MNNCQGYKKTEIGIIPNDWEVKKLREICSPSSKRINPILVQKNYKTIELEHLSKGTGRLLGYVDSKNLKSQKSIFEKGDVLFGKLRPYLKKFLFTEFNGVCTTEIWVLKEQTSLISKWLYYLVQSDRIIEVANQSTGTKMPRAEWKVVGNTEIPLPPLPEQKAIAQVLSDTDSLIQSLEKQIAKKRLIKQGAMQKLLEPKEGWEVKSIFELAEFKKELFDDGDWIESEHITTHGIRLIQTGNIGIGKYVEKENRKYIYQESFLKLKCKVLQEGDLLICRLAEPAGRACIFPDINENKVVTSVDVTIFRPNDNVANRIFLKNIFSTSDWFAKINESVGGTTHKRISRGSLGGIEISIPNIKEQVRIAAILSDMESEIDVLEKKLSKYQQLKQGLMQNLLTGKIRLI